VAIEELREARWSKPPQGAVLNLLEESAYPLRDLSVTLLTHIPLIVTQTWPCTELGSPRQAGAGLVLYPAARRCENQDPVEALHKEGLHTAWPWSRTTLVLQPPGRHRPTIPGPLYGSGNPARFVLAGLSVSWCGTATGGLCVLAYR